MANLVELPKRANNGLSEDSLAKRYGFKLGAGVFGLPVGLAQQWLVTRALGPSGYGSYSFLNAFFSEVIAFFDSGTSIGFYAKLCARSNEPGLIVFYWRLAATIVATLFIGVGALLIAGLGGWLWPAVSPASVVLALLCAVGLWLTMIAGKIVDAYGCTTQGEKVRLVSRFVGLAGFGILFAVGALTLDSIFVAQVVISALLLWLWHQVLKGAGFSLAPRVVLPGRLAGLYGREFWQYSHPLLVYTFVGMLAGLADRWLLQRFSGSIEQGLYGLAFQIGSIGLLFSSAMVPLLARDFAQAHQSEDRERISASYARNIPRLYALSACLGVFMAVESDRIAVVIGGDQFAHAGVATSLMCLYPIHQTYGQMNGSLFYATGQTHLYRNLGLFNIALGLALTVWLLGPPQIGGLSLGSIGLAVKMVLTQLIAVNVQLWIICRQLGFSFLGFATQQLVIVVGFAIIAAGARVAGDLMGPIALVQLATAGALYAGLIIVVTWILPGIAGVSRPELAALAARIYRYRAPTEGR